MKLPTPPETIKVTDQKNKLLFILLRNKYQIMKTKIANVINSKNILLFCNIPNAAP